MRRAQDRGHKMNFRWLGPRRVTNAVSELVHDVAKLDGTNIEHVHCARLKLYRASSENNEVPEELLELAERTEEGYEIVECIQGIGEDPNGIFFHVEWSVILD